jgi:hypothetical protein
LGSWDVATAKALKILGDGAKVPKLRIRSRLPKTKPPKPLRCSTPDACVEKLADLDDTITSYANTVEHFRAEIEKDDFELDAKKDAKKIKQAKAILFGVLDGEIKSCKDDDKSLDELDRHLVLLKKYKPSPSAFK